jgi:pSer/pThr/pTyr-binding forkhead associated (FHA) protein
MPRPRRHAGAVGGVQDCFLHEEEGNRRRCRGYLLCNRWLGQNPESLARIDPLFGPAILSHTRYMGPNIRTSSLLSAGPCTQRVTTRGRGGGGRSPSAPMAALALALVCDEPAGREFVLAQLEAARTGGGGPLLLGRSQARCDIQIPVHAAAEDADEGAKRAWLNVSRVHAKLHRTVEGWRIDDNASINGVFVNGVRVTQRVIQPGDRLTIGCGRNVAVGDSLVTAPAASLCLTVRRLGGEAGAPLPAEGSNLAGAPRLCTNDGSSPVVVEPSSSPASTASQAPEHESSAKAAAAAAAAAILSPSIPRGGEFASESQPRATTATVSAVAPAAEPAADSAADTSANGAPRITQDQQNAQDSDAQDSDDAPDGAIAGQVHSDEAWRASGDAVADELQCAVCCYTLLEPYSLQCSHSFCGPCLYGWLCSRRDTAAAKRKRKRAAAAAERPEWPCPVCRAPITTRPIYVRGLRAAVSADSHPDRPPICPPAYPVCALASPMHALCPG